MKIISNILNSVFVNFPLTVLFFGCHFQTARRNDACDIPLKRYKNCATFLYRKFSEIINGLRADLKILNSVFSDFSDFVQYFVSYFQTVRRIDACDIPLETYGNCATFSCRTFFQIHYSF